MKKVGVNAFITYTKTIRKYVISARDFLTNYLMNEEEDGSIMLVTSSENCKYDFPPVSGVVRAYTALTGYQFKPDANDPNLTHMTMCCEFDLKGHIPEFAMSGIPGGTIHFSHLRLFDPK